MTFHSAPYYMAFAIVLLIVVLLLHWAGVIDLENVR